MRRLKEWIWAAVGAIAVNGYLPGDWTLIQSALILIMLWLGILFGIYFVEERIEEYGRKV